MLDKRNNDNDNIFLIVLDENEKRIDNIEVMNNNDEEILEKNEQDDIVNMNNNSEEPIVCLERMDKPNVEKRKRVRRTAAAQKRDEARVPYKVYSIPLDENVFKITPISQEDQIQEMLRRKDSAKYKYALFKCEECYTGFPNEDRYARHVFRHSEQKGLFKCIICKGRMKTARKLREHMRAHTYEYSCKLCPLVTRRKTVALEHVRFHAGRTFECSKCLVQFKQRTSYLNHVRLKHTSDSVCDICGYTFINQNGLRGHKNRTHAFDENAELQGPHCEVCDIKFFSQKAYDNHLRLSSNHIQNEADPNRISNNATQHPFGNSNRSIQTRPKVMKRRKRTIIKREPITCEQCGLVLDDYRTYSIHFRTAHPGDNRTQCPQASTPHMCEHCGKMFWTKSHYNAHMWVHTGKKMFECDHCQKGYTLKVNLVEHIKREHLNHRPRSYACHICGKLFAYEFNIRRHVFKHSGLRPHKCVSCEKDFTTVDQLRQHVDHVHLKKPWPKKRPKQADKSS